jgi:tetratricopeptide (TPR) repeat protein
VAFPGDLFALAFDPTGQRLAVVADTVVTLVDPESGRVLLHLSELPGQACAIAFSANGDRLAVACSTGQIVMYETAAARRRAWSIQDDPDRRDLDVERARTSVQDAWAEQGNAVDAALDVQKRLHDRAQRWQRIACRMAVLRAQDCARARELFCNSLKTISCWNSPRLWYAMIDAEPNLRETDRTNRSGRRGLALTGMRCWAEAEACLRKAVLHLDRPARKSTENVYRQALARCLWHTGRQEAAREIDPDVKQHAARAEQSPPFSSFDTFAWHVARLPDQDPDRYQQALGWAHEACGGEDRAVFRVTRGALLQRLGRPTEALAEFNAVRERLAGTDHPCLAALAAFSCLSHRALGHEKEACSQFNEFVVCRNTASLALHPDVILLDRELSRALKGK